MTTLQFETVPPFYQGYVQHVRNMDLFKALENANKTMLELLYTIPESRGEYRYQPGKWSIKELVAHVIDAERIFAYRALRFSRNDKTPLAGFDEQLYAPESNANARTVTQLADELKHLRVTSIELFKSFTPEMLQRTGQANNTPVSVINLGYIIAGHESHHRVILQERYLTD